MVEINAHNKRYARAIQPNNLQRIRAVPLNVRYNHGVFIFDCEVNNGIIQLTANSERAIKYLNENTYGTDLPKNWINIVKRNNNIPIASTRNANDPINWFIYQNYIAFFTTDVFRFIYVDMFPNLNCPHNWQFNVVGNREGLFGGIFRLSNGSKTIEVNCGFNNGNSGPKMCINGERIKGRKYFHTEESFNKLRRDLESEMNS